MQIKNSVVRTALLAVSCLLCTAFAVAYSNLAFMEFGGGALTGPLLKMNTYGGMLFGVVLILTFVFRRPAALGALGASLLSMPLYLFLIFPGPFYRIFPVGELKGHRPLPNFVFDRWALLGILLLAFTAYICILNLGAAKIKEDENRYSVRL